MNSSVEVTWNNSNLLDSSQTIATTSQASSTSSTSSLKKQTSISSSFSKQRSQKSQASVENDSVLSPELDLNEVYELAAKNEFPQKEFIVKNKLVFYSAMLHFYRSIRIFKQTPDEQEKLDYKCKICQDVLVSPFKDKSNLYKHLRYHEDYKKWKTLYDQCKKKELSLK